MTANIGPCLTDADAERLVRDLRPGDPERVPWDVHVRQCAACRQRLIAMTRQFRPPSIEIHDDSSIGTENPTTPGIPIGTLVADRYLILDVLGHGGMGTVHLAQDIRLQRPVALKATTLATAPDPARIRHEAAAMASVDHPNVVRVHDCVESEQGLVIAMERVAGGTLRDRLLRGRPSRTEQTEITRGLVAGLAAVHDAGLVHGDFKPDNVLLDDSNGSHARITDFGLATVLRTGRGASGGTPRYMAPEIQAGAAPSQAADQYALAATLVEMAVGPAMIAEATSQESGVVPWTNLVARLPGQMRKAMVRALDDVPERRHASIMALGVALTSARQRRHWQYAMSGLALVVAILTGANIHHALAVAECNARADHDIHAFPTAFETIETAALKRSETAWQTWRDTWRGQVAGVCASRPNEAWPDPEASPPAGKSPRIARCLVYERALMNRLVATLEITGAGGEEAKSIAMREIERLGGEGLCAGDAANFDFAEGRHVPIETYLALRTLIKPTRASVDRALAEIARDPPNSLQIDGLIRRSFFETELGLSRAAGQTLLDALTVTRLANRPDRELAVLHLLIDMALFRDMDLSRADMALAAARVLVARDGSPSETAWLGHVEAWRDVVAGRLGTALRRLWKEFGRESISDADRARAASALGGAAMRWGLLDLAEEAFGEQLRLREDIHGPAHSRAAGAIHNLAQVAIWRGDFDRARQLLGRARAMRTGTRSADFPHEKDRGIDVIDRSEAIVDMLNSNEVGAVQTLARITQRLGHQFAAHHIETWETRVFLAEAAARAGDFDTHATAAELAFEHAVMHGYDRGPLWSRLLRARAIAAALRGDDGEAATWLGHAEANDATSELPATLRSVGWGADEGAPRCYSREALARLHTPE